MMHYRGMSTPSWGKQIADRLFSSQRQNKLFLSVFFIKTFHSLFRFFHEGQIQWLWAKGTPWMSCQLTAGPLLMAVAATQVPTAHQEQFCSSVSCSRTLKHVTQFHPRAAGLQPNSLWLLNIRLSKPTSSLFSFIRLWRKPSTSDHRIFHRTFWKHAEFNVKGFFWTGKWIRAVFPEVIFYLPLNKTAYNPWTLIRGYQTKRWMLIDMFTLYS